MANKRKYRLSDPLGIGGMGEVFRGEILGASGFRRAVAIKRLPAELSQDQDRNALFKREAQVCGKLHHPNIVAVFDFDYDEAGRLLLVMELVDGIDLSGLLRTGSLSIPMTVFIIRKVLDALVYAHARDIVHRDISPHNILISRTGEVKLTDFGLAEVVGANADSDDGEGQSSAIRGKPGYFSPDQILGLELDARADLFSVGVVLYELLTGELPFGRGHAAEAVGRLLTASPEPIRAFRDDVPDDLEQLVLRLLQRERALRPSTARQVQDALPPTAVDASALAALLDERIGPPAEPSPPALDEPFQPEPSDPTPRQIEIADRSPYPRPVEARRVPVDQPPPARRAHDVPAHDVPIHAEPAPVATERASRPTPSPAGRRSLRIAGLAAGLASVVGFAFWAWFGGTGVGRGLVHDLPDRAASSARAVSAAPATIPEHHQGTTPFAPPSGKAPSSIDRAATERPDDPGRTAKRSGGARSSGELDRTRPRSSGTHGPDGPVAEHVAQRTRSANPPRSRIGGRPRGRRSRSTSSGSFTRLEFGDKTPWTLEFQEDPAVTPEESSHD